MNTNTSFGVIAVVLQENVENFLVDLWKAKSANCCEIRIDELSERSLEILLPSMADMLVMPTILTYYSKEDGGRRKISLKKQWNFWARLPQDLLEKIRDPQSQVYVNWPLRLHIYDKDLGKKTLFPPKKLGCTLHNFKETPSDLKLQLELIEDTCAEAFLKYVTMAKNSSDGPRMMRIFEGRTDTRPLIAFCMGEKGKLTRRICISKGSAGTYGSIGNTKIAPGQISVKDLMEDHFIQTALGI